MVMPQLVSRALQDITAPVLVVLQIYARRVPSLLAVGTTVFFALREATVSTHLRFVYNSDMF